MKLNFFNVEKMTNSQKLPYKVTRAKDSKQVTISLFGNLSLDTIELVKLMLIKNLNLYQTFHVKLVDVENIDLGFIQLLYSFKSSVENNSKIVTFEIILQDEHNQLLEHAGLKDLLIRNQ
jgi:ABC-type transporter Mla MlaB component